LPNCLFLTPQESLGAPKQSVCETHCPQPAPVGHQLNLAHHLPKLTNRKIARQAYNRIFENLIKRFSNSREIKLSGFLLQPFQFENETNPRTARLIRQPMLAIGGESAIAGLRQCSLITGRRRMADPVPPPPDRRRLCTSSAAVPLLRDTRQVDQGRFHHLRRALYASVTLRKRGPDPLCRKRRSITG
jgi:hypothetical protein